MAVYSLRCLHPDCERIYPPEPGMRLVCDGETDGSHGPALLRPVFESPRLTIRDDLPGIFRFVDWLPVDFRYLAPRRWSLGAPMSYRSERLAGHLDLANLFIAFSGWWPDRGGNLVTRTFKEFECQSTFARYLSALGDDGPMPLIIASAGNTANGFALLGAQFDIPIYLVVPVAGLGNLLLPYETEPFLIAVDGDYSEATAMADTLSRRVGLLRDGGVRNVARRSGMGTVMLNAVAAPEGGSGRMYDHYFQAVGSASGAIAAWEASELLRADGRFGDTMPRIHMAQNEPFTPIVDFWESDRSEAPVLNAASTRARIDAVSAQVLTNRTPPLTTAGGICDVLTRSRGGAWRVSNEEAFQAARLFRETEGVDAGPAASVALGALQKAIAAGKVGREDHVLLHITGGGRAKQLVSNEVQPIPPRITVGPDEIDKAAAAIGTPPRVKNASEALRRSPACQAVVSHG